MNGMRTRPAIILALAVAGMATPARAAAQAQAWDSLREALASDDWNERHWALQRINRIEGALPPELVTPIIGLLAREAALRPRPGGEDYGEYIMELVIAAARTDDDRAVRGVVALGGIGSSGAVSRFIATHAQAVFLAGNAAALMGRISAAGAPRR